MNDRPRPQTSRHELTWAQRWVAHHAVLDDAGLDSTTTDDADTRVHDDLLTALERTPVELDADQRRTLLDAVEAYAETELVEKDQAAADELLELLSD